MADTEAPLERQPLLHSVHVAATEVYPVIHMIRHVSDTPLTHEALTAPDLTYTLVRPLLEKYGTIQRQGNMSVVFCLLLNRVYFFRDGHLATAALSRTRADFCEILAIRALREHAEDMLELALVLTTSWSVYSGAPSAVLDRAREEYDDDLEDRVGNAIEMAILSQAKRFIKSSPCQKVIDGIWSGKIVYQAESIRSILSDTYKRNPIHFYDPHKAPLLDHYRLKVPAIRSVLEYTNFLVLFILFICAIEFNELDGINTAEIVFMVYALGFTLEKVAAMQEHGIKVYFKGTWNGFDLAFVTLYCTYAVMRLVGVYDDRRWAREMGNNCLALIAVLMFPRLAFVTFKDNVMVLSLRAMIIQFVVLMMIAAFCFGGFLYALWTLGKDNAGYSAGTVAWWMLDLWFGLDASGFDNASHFHPIFGPLLMITYACLSNTLLLTGMFSQILSHTFSTINDDASAEAMFRRAVSTIEGVKADSLFSYQPPVNLVALCLMYPASYILTPRWFHKVNVFMIRLTSFPILICIAIYERQAKQTGTFTFYETVSAAAEKLFDTLPRHLKRLTLFEGLSGPDADIDAIFELEEELEESALDMEETDSVPPIGITPRRVSQASRRRPSGASIRQMRRTPSSAGHSTPPRSPSPHKAELPEPGPSTSPQSQTRAQQPPQHIPLPRARLNSIVTRGLDVAQAAASPLAQIFQPLIVDDDIVPEAQAQIPVDGSGAHPGPGEGHGGAPAPAPGALVSYGPATRRRLMSLHAAPSPPRRMRTYSVAAHGPHVHRPDAYGATGESSTALRRFPTHSSPQSRSHLGLYAAAPLSTSPDDGRGSLSEQPEEAERGRSPGPHETAAQVESEGNSEGSEWERRLASIEDRQKRIEDILVEISRNLRRGGGEST
ncbi:hypothetical protein DICSQDRAFT_100749 [Dichomitus squalens LYAD-421 SS1]|uniref:uncharacterized protein n=1 Tax=Dichomitus squalens (strain LYAD-421) TaxID=732165 RepID=UPI00044112B4|nr:uncharacterized protein DICSQDRAFT_100749 [Dichomitus squalens LYAD-421 SS1]EJF64109.1 hypothetical protein DICSQDRAFT_100749 [Dichomitus squalens LYAD-421 SS1]